MAVQMDTERARHLQMSGPLSLTEMSVFLRRVPNAVWPRTIQDESIVLDEKRSNGSIRTAYAFAVVHHSGVKATTRLPETVDRGVVPQPVLMACKPEPTLGKGHLTRRGPPSLTPSILPNFHYLPS